MEKKLSAMDDSTTLKLENVQLLDKYNARNSSRGTLYFATTHLIFVDHDKKKEKWILLMHICYVERLPVTAAGAPLLVRTDTFQSAVLVIPRERDCHLLYHTLLRLSRPASIEELYCFQYKPSADELPKSAGWNYFDLQTEYQRMDVPNQHWVLCTENQNYELCDTYPARLYVPAHARSAVLRGSAGFRSRARLPALAYLHASGAAVARASQPLSGFSARCLEDEQMLDCVRRANPNCSYMYVVDTRPRINAMVNRAAGKGYENEAFYENIKFQFSGIGNIHVMRKSLHKLVETCEQTSPTMSSFLSGLESSGWLKHIKCILETGAWVASAVGGGVSVLVHCSDGWDRTAQVCSLAALLLDPHYRTINGYQALIEKDWLAFGHKFSERCAHAAGDAREKAPVLTQLLDCTWQLLRQLPDAFQFNELFLLTLHDHAHACQYGTFVGNSEKERNRLKLSERTYSLWGYMANHLDEYRNPLYNPKAHPDTITPDLSSQSIRFWRGMYCRHDDGVHPREAANDVLLASCQHSTALQYHMDLLAERISALKGLLSRKKKSECAREAAPASCAGGDASADNPAMLQPSADNTLLDESGGLRETEQHPLQSDSTRPDTATQTDGGRGSNAFLARLSAEADAVALDWTSLKNVTVCACSTPLPHLSTKHHCWQCGRVCCTRCVSRPAPRTRRLPLCAVCRQVDT